MKLFLFLAVSSFLLFGCVTIQTKGDPQIVMMPTDDRDTQTRFSQIYLEPATQRDRAKVNELFHNYFSQLGFRKVPPEKLAISETCSARDGHSGANPAKCPELVAPSCLEKYQTLQTSRPKPFELRRIVCMGMFRMPTGLVFEDIDNAYPPKKEAIPMQDLPAGSVKEFQTFTRSAQQEWLAFFRSMKANVGAKRLEWVRISKWYPESKNSKGYEADVSDRVKD